MQTNIVLIDFESVQPESLVALDHAHFKVMVFVGANQARVPFQLAEALQRMGNKAEYIKITGTGRNALDFHIAFHIGQLISQFPDAHFYIISKDTGFDPLIQHLKSRKIQASRLARVESLAPVKTGPQKSPEERAQFVIAKLKQPHVTRPRTEKTLSRTVASFFQKQLSDEDIAAVIAAMQSAGFLAISDGKVSYTPDG